MTNSENHKPTRPPVQFDRVSNETMRDTVKNGAMVALAATAVALTVANPFVALGFAAAGVAVCMNKNSQQKQQNSQQEQTSIQDQAKEAGAGLNNSTTVIVHSQEKESNSKIPTQTPANPDFRPDKDPVRGAGAA